MKIIIKPYEFIHRCMVEHTKDDGSTEELHFTIFKNLDTGAGAYEVTDDAGAYVSDELAEEIVSIYLNEHNIYL